MSILDRMAYLIIGSLAAFGVGLTGYFIFEKATFSATLMGLWTLVYLLITYLMIRGKKT
jgi:hypothetical protein